MWARATRLEFIIVSIALLALLMCTKPPKSGNAGVGDSDEQNPEVILPIEQFEPESSPDHLDARPSETAIDTTLDAPIPARTDDEATETPPAPRIAVVDARGCTHLNYQDVMYGRVTVRWVWNGTKFVPHKVCVVEEEGGVSSVWSFDQQDEVSLSELSPDKD